MKLTFKQYNSVAELPHDEVTEEKLTEIFGAFFGNKPQADKNKAVADLRNKKANVQKTLQQKTAAKTANTQKLDKNKEWMDWVASQKNKDSQPASAQKKIDKVPSSQLNAAGARAAERDWVASLRKEDFVSEKIGTEIPYRGYKIKKTETGNYHVMKGPKFIGHAKDHQEAMKKIDAHSVENGNEAQNEDIQDLMQKYGV